MAESSLLFALVPGWRAWVGESEELPYVSLSLDISLFISLSLSAHCLSSSLSISGLPLEVLNLFLSSCLSVSGFFESRS